MFISNSTAVPETNHINSVITDFVEHIPDQALATPIFVDFSNRFNQQLENRTCSRVDEIGSKENMFFWQFRDP